MLGVFGRLKLRVFERWVCSLGNHALLRVFSGLGL